MIADVILADFVDCGGHSHLQWRCPDCGRICNSGLDEATESFRVACAETEREFLVIPIQIEFPRAVAETLNTFK